MNRLVLSVILVCLWPHAKSVSANKKCGETSTQRRREEMEAKRDLNVPPCDDFYAYACGNWETTYRLRQLGASDTLTSIKAQNKLLLIKHFDSTDDEGPLNAQDDVIPTPKCLHDFYKSCMDKQFAERRDSVRTYADELLQLGEWPILSPDFSESRARESFKWERISGQLRRYGVDSLWRILVQPNWQNAEQMVVYVTAPEFSFLRRSKRADRGDSVRNDRSSSRGSSEGESDEVFLYRTYVKYLILDMGVRVRKALALAGEVVRFEQELIGLTVGDYNSVVLTAPQTLASLLSQFPDIRLRLFFDALMEDMELPKDYAEQLMIVADGLYLRKLSKLLKKTSLETIGKYLLVQFLIHFEVNLHDALSFRLRQEHCLKQANTFLPKELSRLFLDLQHDGNGMEFLESTQRNLNKLFDNLKEDFESLIKNTTVFDHNHNTRADGLEKLYAMELILPLLTNSSDCAADVAGKRLLLSHNYDSNLLHLSKLKTRQELLDVISALENISYSGSYTSLRGSWQAEKRHASSDYGPLVVNAYYRLKKNAIEIPLGLLALSIYDNCWEAPIVYGTIAFIVGHELMHGFDYDGLNYDKTGNISDGWDPKSIIAFGTKASCYLGARYENAHSNVNENIADSEGLRLALGALQRLAGPLPTESLKEFFTSFAQLWCRRSSAHEERHALHAANKERVNNALANFQAFAETFQCKLGSTLNPAEKCRVW